jgi:hypothetical protein
MELALDLTCDQELSRALVDRNEPVGVNGASILAGFLERAWGQLLDDPGEEVLAELDFGRGLHAAVR